MSYAEKANRRRPGAALAVLLIEGVLAYGVVAGLVATGQRISGPHIIGELIPLPKDQPKPPPPHDSHMPKAQQDQQLVRPAIDLGPIAPPTFSPDLVPPLGGTDLGPPVTHVDPPIKQFTPIGAHPRGAAAGWISDSDYPTADLRLGHQGTLRYRLAVGSDGRVNECTITQSSGWPGLDAAACTKLTARAKFEPATDASGAKTAGAWSGSVTWRIPEE